ncbi:MAG TPA: (d)CMP kinase [Burkholderiaceae bacterium]|nr:(d)CMP kinase [Burkholderiaceae bacterium]
MSDASTRHPVITIDGPTASGKGTVADHVARALGWHVLDSGALYRLTALSVETRELDIDDTEAVADAARGLDVEFREGRVWMGGDDVTGAIRLERIGELASRIAALRPVRAALLDRQRRFLRPPGLVADGRDMGTVVFPDAHLKIFLVADVDSRAERRCKQLKGKGISANLAALLEDMRARDARDRNRDVSPLVPAADAKTIDSSDLSIDETVNAVLDLWSSLGAQDSGKAR